MPLIYPTAFFGGGGTIAFPTLRGTATYRDTTYQNSHDVTLPAGTSAGDKVIVFGAFGGSGFGDGVTVATPSGWERFGYLRMNDFAEVIAFWRDAASSMSSVTIARQGSTDAFIAYCNAYSFSVHSDFAPEITALAIQASTASPNPPPLTVPGEWGSSPHATWLSCLYKFGTSTTNAVSAGYSNAIGTLDGGARMASASLNSRATTEDPGAWSISAANGGVPFTIAVRGPE